VQLAFSFLLARLLILVGWKRRVVHANLFHVRSEFPKQLEFYRFKGREQLYRALLYNMCREFVYVLLNRPTAKEVITERAQSLIPRMQEGGLLLTAHIGNWEWMGPWLRKLGVPLIASYSPLKSKTANKWMQKFRNRNGAYTIALSDSAQPLRTLIRNHRLFTFLADQDSRERRNESAEFFSQKVRTSPLPSFYSRTSDAPIFYAWVVRNASGELVLDAIELTKESLMRGYHTELERSILENPEQYYGWTHRRFLSTNPTIYKQT